MPNYNIISQGSTKIAKSNKEYEIVLDDDGKYLRVIRCELDDNKNITWEYGEVVFESTINLEETSNAKL
jgi:hypothetical protein